MWKLVSNRIYLSNSQISLICQRMKKSSKILNKEKTTQPARSSGRLLAAALAAAAMAK
jgi:hypothetical protein